MRSRHVVEYYLTIKRDEVLIYPKHGQTLQTSCSVKEARHKDHVLYDSIYIKFPEQANLQGQKVHELLLRTGSGAEGGWEVTTNRQVSFEDKNSLELDPRDSCATL